MHITALAIPDVKIITPQRYGDERGYLFEAWNREAFAKAGINLDFVQDNQSFSREKGTLRGLHFQSPPFAQDKLVRVITGAIWDVAVDLRRSSPTYGQWVAEEISAQKGNQILVPVGFAHGFITLTPDTTVVYKVTNLYSKDHDNGLAYDDPDFAISWPDIGVPLTLSAKDQAQPAFASFQSPFE